MNKFCLPGFLTVALLTPLHAQEINLSSLDLNHAIDLAIQRDPWLNGSQHRQDALNSESISAGTLPDPRISLSATNFQSDSFDMDRDPMSQLTIGVSQMFPRGDSLQLSSRQKQELATQEPLLRQDRKAKVTAMVAQMWLEAYKAQESIRLIEQDRSLFENLVDVTLVNYASALGRARQQDIIRAQLELTRLDDRFYALQLQQDSAQKRLSEWLGDTALLPLDSQLPNLSGIQPELLLTPSGSDRQAQYQIISQHPLLQAFEQRIAAMQTGVELARQKYKPEWGVSAQYGFRDQDQSGKERSDLVSLGVNFDLPLFTENRQDKDVSAATSLAEAIKTDKLLLARQMLAELDDARARLLRLNERFNLYQQQLLPQMDEQADASLTAYNNDDGDFAEAVRARIAVLNARIDALGIAVERQQVLARIGYLLTQATNNEAQADQQSRTNTSKGELQ